MKLLRKLARRLFWLAYFIVYILREILVSNIKVAYGVLSSRKKLSPAVIAIPIHTKTDLKTTVLANLISLTPGTLALDVSEDKKILFLHTMFGKDADELRASIERYLERPILEIFND